MQYQPTPLRLFLPLLFAGIAAPTILASDDLTPRIGAIEVFGERTIPEKKILETLGVTAGSPLPASRGNLEDRLNSIRGVVATRLEAVCCNQGKMILYVGIQERNTPHLEWHPTPGGDQSLPEDLQNLYQEFLELTKQAAREGSTGEDLTNGYSLMAFPDARSCQQALEAQVEKYPDELHDVLRKAADDEQRAAAAYLIQYTPRSSARAVRQMLDDLQYALQDQAEVVRANAMRALKAVMVGGKLHPEQGVVVVPTWYVELLNSAVWSDRRGATLALVELTDSRDTEILAEIRERALPSVAEMSRWRDLEHALPPFILAGRLAGLTEEQIQAAWVSGDRETVIKKALASEKKESLPEKLLRRARTVPSPQP